MVDSCVPNLKISELLALIGEDGYPVTSVLQCFKRLYDTRIKMSNGGNGLMIKAHVSVDDSFLIVDRNLSVSTQTL